MKLKSIRAHRLPALFTATLLTMSLFAPLAQAEEQCISAAAHISDGWCQAVDCAPTYVEAGLCQLLGDPTSESDPVEAVDDPGEAEPKVDDEEIHATDEDAHGDVEDIDGERSEDATECVSTQPHISDAWCRATNCHPAYIDSGHCERLVDEASANEPSEDLVDVEEVHDDVDEADSTDED
jgi:hypothetical protein